MKRTTTFVVVFLVSYLCGAISVAAQTPAPAPTQSATGTTDATESGESDDLSITASVTARELSFEVVGNPSVEFTGSHERKTVWEAERDNLPRPVEPGVTYRNIGIRLKITSRFADIDRIVAEALGEVPVSDDAGREGENAAPSEAPAPTSTTPPQTTSQPQGGTPR